MADDTPDPDPTAELNRSIHGTTRLWAQLDNVRYWMLLTDLVHVLLLTGPTALPPAPRRGAGFGVTATPLDQAITDTLDTYRHGAPPA